MSYEVREDRYYTKTHEWLLLENGVGVVGITDYAQKSLHEIVFVELPEEGKEVKMGERIGTVESIKAVSDVYSPISGKIVEVNKELEEKPELLNSSPYDQGWMVKIEVADKEEVSKLLKPEEYKKLLQEKG